MTPAAGREVAELAGDGGRRPLLKRWFGPLGGGSQRASVLALASTAFGSGVLALPWVFAQLGLLLGLTVLASAALASLLSQRLLANAAYTTGLSSYQRITRKTLGAATSVSLDTVIFVYTFGSVCGYLVFIQQFAPQLCESLGLPVWLRPGDGGAMHVTIGFAIFPLTPLCMVRYLSMMRYATLLSVVSLVMVALIIICTMPSKYAELTSHASTSLPANWWLWPNIDDWQTFPRVVAICFYSFCCHVNLFAKYRELDSPTSHRVQKVLVRSVGLELVIYALVGFCGLLALGPACSEDVPAAAWPSCTPLNILASPRFDGFVGVVARICMIITLLVCIPLNLAAGREVVEHRLLAWSAGAEGSFSPAATPPHGTPPSSPRQPGSPEICFRLNSGTPTATVVDAPPNRDIVTGLPDAEARSARSPEAEASLQPPQQLPLAGHLALSLGFLYLAAFVAIVYAHINVILSILGGGCAVTFMFTIPIFVSLALFFGWTETIPNSPRIGRFLGVTRRGVALAAMINFVCIGLGYLSAILAVVDMVTGAA